MSHRLCATLCVMAGLLAPACAPRSGPAPRVAAPAVASGVAQAAPRVALPAVAVRDMTPEGIRVEIWPETRARFVPMSEEDRRRLGALVAGLTSAARAGGDVRALAARATEIGFRVEFWRVRGRVFWVLLEARAQRRGAGAYLLRPGPHLTGQPEIVLQAPHVFFDRGTGHIAAALFFGREGQGRARALFTNTAYRYAGVEGRVIEDPEQSPATAPAEPGTSPATRPRTRRAAAPARAPADVAHAADHAFQAATEAIVRELGQVIVIQLHGFAERPGKPEIILSSGVDEIGALLGEIATRLAAVFERVRRYPDEIDELGGTRNVQGQTLALDPRAHFVHVELSARTRARLRTTPALLARFADALLSPGDR